MLWIALIVVLHAALWVAGFESRALSDAVDFGAARAESARIGEQSDDLVRKAINLQRESLPFWTTLARLGDFVVEPTLLLARTVAVAVIFAALAALTGRPIGFNAGLAAAAKAQGFWVAGLATRVVLTMALRRLDIETSAVLLLPPGRYDASVILLARQIDPFTIFGWSTLAVEGGRRRQVNVPSAMFVCLFLAFDETLFRVVCGWIAGAGMRLTILPG